MWHVCTVAFLQGAFSTLQGPAESATVTLLVPEGHRRRANAIMELGFPLASVLTPTPRRPGLRRDRRQRGALVDLATFVVQPACCSR